MVICMLSHLAAPLLLHASIYYAPTRILALAVGIQAGLTVALSCSTFVVVVPCIDNLGSFMLLPVTTGLRRDQDLPKFPYSASILQRYCSRARVALTHCEVGAVLGSVIDLSCTERVLVCAHLAAPGAGRFYLYAFFSGTMPARKAVTRFGGPQLMQRVMCQLCSICNFR